MPVVSGPSVASEGTKQVSGYQQPLIANRAQQKLTHNDLASARCIKLATRAARQRSNTYLPHARLQFTVRNPHRTAPIDLSPYPIYLNITEMESLSRTYPSARGERISPSSLLPERSHHPHLLELQNMPVNWDIAGLSDATRAPVLY